MTSAVLIYFLANSAVQFISKLLPTGITEVLLKLHFSLEKATNSLRTDLKQEMISLERAPIPVVSSANPSVLSVSLADSFLNLQ